MSDSKEDSQSKKYNLFEDKGLKAQFDQLSDEDKKNYKMAGEYMYQKDVSTVDFDARIRESVEYVKLGLRSGLMPKWLSTDEKNLMRNVYGDKWYEEYGYPSEDYDGK